MSSPGRYPPSESSHGPDRGIYPAHRSVRNYPLMHSGAELSRKRRSLERSLLLLAVAGSLLLAATIFLGLAIVLEFNDTGVQSQEGGHMEKRGACFGGPKPDGTQRGAGGPGWGPALPCRIAPASVSRSRGASRRRIVSAFEETARQPTRIASRRGIGTGCTLSSSPSPLFASLMTLGFASPDRARDTHGRGSTRWA